MPNWAEGVTALTSGLAFLAVVLAGVQIRHVSRQMHRDFESHYLLRYWALMDRRSRRFKLGGRPNRMDGVLIADYLALCEDQLTLRALGRVTDDTYGFWARDIVAQAGQGAYRAFLASAQVTDFPRLRSLLTQPGHDPLKQHRLGRLWRGL